MSLILGSRRPAVDRPETEITNLERCPIFSARVSLSLSLSLSLGDSQEISARKTRDQRGPDVARDYLQCDYAGGDYAVGGEL